MKENVQNAVERLERAGYRLMEMAGYSNEPKAIFLRSWGTFLKARADWLWAQQLTGLVAAEDLLRLSAMELDVAESFTGEDTPLPV